MRKIVIQRKKRSKESTVKEILALLGTSEPKSKWQIMKELGKSYGNVHESIKILLREGMVKIQDSQHSARNPKIDVEYYGLTVHGLIIILPGETRPSYFDKIAETQKAKLPEIFNKWLFFEQNSVKAFVIDRMRKAANIAISELPGLRGMVEELSKNNKPERKREYVEAIIQGRFTINVFLPSYNQNFFSFTPSAELLARDEAQENFLAILKKDRELREFIRWQNEVILERLRIQTENLKAFQKAWTNTKERPSVSYADGWEPNAKEILRKNHALAHDS